MKTRFHVVPWLILGVVSVLWLRNWYSCRPEASRPGVDDGPWGRRIEVVAAVSGYCTESQLPTGETVTQIVPRAEDAPFDAKGFLFCVLSPAEFQGRLFKVHHDSPSASGDPFTMFDTEVRYRLMVPVSLISFPDAGCSMHSGLFPPEKSTPRREIEDLKDIPALLGVLRKREQVLRVRIKDAADALEAEKTLRPDSKQTITSLEARLHMWKSRDRFLSDRITDMKRRIAEVPNQPVQPTPGSVTPRASSSTSK